MVQNRIRPTLHSSPTPTAVKITPALVHKAVKIRRCAANVHTISCHKTTRIMVHRNRTEIETDELTRGVVRKTDKKMQRLSLLFTSSQREQTKKRSGLKLPPAGRKQEHCPPLLPFTRAALHRHRLVGAGEKGLTHTKLSARISLAARPGLPKTHHRH